MSGLLVYCPDCGLGPQPVGEHVALVRGARSSWPRSTADTEFWVGTFTCGRCGSVMPVEVPDEPTVKSNG